MSTELDRMLRKTLADLADEARPATLVGPARRRAARIRRRRRALATTGVAAAVALAIAAGVGGPTLLGNDRTNAPGVDVSPGPVPPVSPVPLVTTSAVPTTLVRVGDDIAILAVYDHGGEARVWDRQRGRYTVVAATTETVAPAPTGTRVQIADQTGVTLLDLADGRRRSLQAGIPHRVWSWSSDGAKLAGTSISKTSDAITFNVMDAASGEVKSFEYDGSAGTCNEHCNVVWHPNGTELALAITDTSTQRDESTTDAQRGLQLFSATTGRPTRVLPVRAAVYSSCAWAPDGRHVLGAGTETVGGRRQQVSQIIEVATGEAVPVSDGGWRAGCWSSSGRLFVQSDNVINVWNRLGQVVETLEVPPAFRDKTLVVGRV